MNERQLPKTPDSIEEQEENTREWTFICDRCEKRECRVRKALLSIALVPFNYANIFRCPCDSFVEKKDPVGELLEYYVIAKNKTKKTDYEHLKEALIKTGWSHK
jgi:hypothetical protein